MSLCQHGASPERIKGPGLFEFLLLIGGKRPVQPYFSDKSLLLLRKLVHKGKQVSTKCKKSQVINLCQALVVGT